MKHPRNLTVLIFAVLFAAVSAPVEADQPVSANGDSSKQTIQDRFGDSLPTGATRRLGTTRLRQRNGVLGVAFSPDGKQLVSTGWGDSIRFWNLNSGKQLRRLVTPDTTGTFAVAFAPDGKMIAAVGEQGSVRLWELETKRLLLETIGHRENLHGIRVFGVAYAPDGLTFATAGADKSVRLWDVATGTELLELQDQGGSDAHPIAFSPDGKFFASGSGRRDAKITIWNLEIGAEQRVIEKAHQREIYTLTFTPDGKQLISAGMRLRNTGKNTARSISEIFLWDVETGTNLGKFETDEELIGRSSAAISGDGKILCSSHHDRIVVWEFAKRKPIRVIKSEATQLGGRTHGLAISPDGKLVASRAYDNKVHLWEIATGDPVFGFEQTHTDAIISVAFSPDGSLIATGSADKTLRIWDAKSGEYQRAVRASSGWIKYAEFFPDGERIVLGAETHVKDKPDYQGELKIVRVADGETIHHIDTTDRLMCGDISLDGSRIAIGTGLGRGGPFADDETPAVGIEVWDSRSGEKVNRWEAGDRELGRVMFAPTRNEVWSIGGDGKIRLWNIDTGEEVHETDLVPTEQRPFGSQGLFSDDTNFAISGSLLTTEPQKNQGYLVRVSTTNGEPQWQMPLANRWPAQITLSSDSSIIAVYERALRNSNAKNRIAFFSSEDGRELHSIELDDGAVRSLAFSPDGSRLATGMTRGDTLIWDLSILPKN